MALAHQTALLSVSDAKIKALLTDPAAGTATYDASWTDLPDITTVTLAGDTDVKIRRGDGVIRDQRQILTGLTLTIENTTLPFDVLAKLEGGTVADTGTTPNQITTYDYTKASRSKYVMFECQCVDTDYVGGDFHLIVYKAKLSNKVELGLTDDDFQTYSYELGAVSRNSDDKYYRLVANETLAAIA